MDRAHDFLLSLTGKLSRIRRDASRLPRQRVLIVGVEVPSRADDIHVVVKRLANSRHHVETSVVKMGDRGKFANIDLAIREASSPLASFDWLIIADDDFAFDEHFLDQYLAVATRADLALSMPAHRYASYASYRVTRRQPGSVARRTRFVEIGPLTVIRSDLFQSLIPFPTSRYCWGIDVLWSVWAIRHGWRIGLVDAPSIRHLRPIAVSYDSKAALAEAKAMLASHDVRLTREDLLGLTAPRDRLDSV